MRQRAIDPQVFRDKVMGCWLGKNAGGTLGEPLEEKFGRDEMFDIDWYPVLEEGGIPNDDLELQLIWLQLILEKGPGITAADMTQAWMDCIAYNFDEYGLSKANMQRGLLPPVCGWHNNAFRDCMGSPIRSEIWACLAPGCPEIAAHYAFLDAIVDHGGGESVYGEVFNAVLESAAFFNSDPFALLQLALASIPAQSATHRCVSRVIENFRAGMSYKDNRNDVKDAFYNPVAQYSPLNLGFQTIGWLYGTDFGDAICKAVNCGWDTDCTAATLGAILGIIHGAKKLPQKWLAPLGQEITTNMTTGGICNLTAPTNIAQLTDLVCETTHKVARYWGAPLVFAAQAPVCTRETFEAPRLDWEGYRANEISFTLGALRQTLRYDTAPVLMEGIPARVTLTLQNPHPVEKEVFVRAVMPQGVCIRPQTTQLTLAANGQAQLHYEITAAAPDILDTTQGYLCVESAAQPAQPALPLVLLGGSRWLFSPLFPGKRLEDDCGVAEEAMFTQPPHGFAEAWRAGNDLETQALFPQQGVVYALHHLFAPQAQKVVLGVPNNGRMRLYFNGAPIHETKETVPLRPNLGNGGAMGDLSNYVTTELRQGWNQLLIKLESGALPHAAHFTLGGISETCVKNHGSPVLGLRRALFQWQA